MTGAGDTMIKQNPSSRTLYSNRNKIVTIKQGHACSNFQNISPKCLPLKLGQRLKGKDYFILS